MKFVRNVNWRLSSLDDISNLFFYRATALATISAADTSSAATTNETPASVATTPAFPTSSASKAGDYACTGRPDSKFCGNCQTVFDCDSDETLTERTCATGEVGKGEAFSQLFPKHKLRKLLWYRIREFHIISSLILSRMPKVCHEAGGEAQCTHELSTDQCSCTGGTPNSAFKINLLILSLFLYISDAKNKHNSKLQFR